jgi:hypothetical protein
MRAASMWTMQKIIAENTRCKDGRFKLSYYDLDEYRYDDDITEVGRYIYFIGRHTQVTLTSLWLFDKQSGSCHCLMTSPHAAKVMVKRDVQVHTAHGEMVRRGVIRGVKSALVYIYNRLIRTLWRTC